MGRVRKGVSWVFQAHTVFLLTEIFSPAYHDGTGAADSNHTHVVNGRYNTLILISQIFITLSHLQAFGCGIPSAQSAILSPSLEVILYKPNSKLGQTSYNYSFTH